MTTIGVTGIVTNDQDLQIEPAPGAFRIVDPATIEEIRISTKKRKIDLLTPTWWISLPWNSRSLGYAKGLIR